METTKLPHEIVDEEIEELRTLVDEVVEELDKQLDKGSNLTIEKLYHKMIDIENYALSNNKDILELKKQSYKYDIAVLNETHFIKKGLGTHNKITYGVLFGVGTIFGMMYQTWMPYANILWELVKLGK